MDMTLASIGIMLALFCVFREKSRTVNMLVAILSVALANLLLR